MRQEWYYPATVQVADTIDISAARSANNANFMMMLATPEMDWAHSSKGVQAPGDEISVILTLHYKN